MSEQKKATIKKLQDSSSVFDVIVLEKTNIEEERKEER